MMAVTVLGLMYPSNKEKNESIPLLLTSKHVIENAKRALVEFAEGDGEKPIQGKSFKVEMDGKYLNQFHNSDHDLSAIPIGPILNQMFLTIRIYSSDQLRQI